MNLQILILRDAKKINKKNYSIESINYEMCSNMKNKYGN